MLLRETWHIRYTENAGDLREELEQKRVEYEERLERVDDEQRRTQLKNEIKALDQVIIKLHRDSAAFMEEVKREQVTVLKKPSPEAVEENLLHQSILGDSDKESCEKAEGLLGTPDYEDGITLFKQLAKEGNLRAMLRLSTLYDRGHRIYRDREKGLAWLEKVYAAVGHQPERLLELGEACFRGTTVYQDIRQAHLLYLEADKRGATLKPEHMITIGNNYHHGGYGIKKAPTLAIQWYERAGQEGESDGYRCAGDLYYFGMDDFPCNYVRATQLYKKAMEMGNIRSLHDVGYAYYWGHGVPLNKEKGFAYFLEAAEKGVQCAQCVVGDYYAVGQPWLSQDYKKAVFWYRKAIDPAEHDGVASHEAENGLGLLYQKGTGVPQNYYKAAELFLKAAEGGESDAAVNLGHCYEMGWGCERNIEKATHYMKMAADKGNTAAARWLKQRRD